MKKAKFIPIDLVRKISDGLENFIDSRLNWESTEDQLRDSFRGAINRILPNSLIDSTVKDRLFEMYVDENELGRKIVSRFLIAYHYTRYGNIILEPWEGKKVIIKCGSGYKTIKYEINSVSKSKNLLKLA